MLAFSKLKSVDMKLYHLRVEQTKDSTRGILIQMDGDKPVYLTSILEDGYRETKVKGETRIDPAAYFVVPIQFGRFYQAYSAAHGHKFAIALMSNPPEDTAGRHGNIRVHKGNEVTDTLGCCLVGNNIHLVGENFEIPQGMSTPAYLAFYNFLYQFYDETTKKFKEEITWSIIEQFIKK